jgi:uncharacterized protein YbjT (DUF2867 family)
LTENPRERKASPLTIPIPNITDISSNFIREAKKKGVKSIIKLSALSAGSEPTSTILRLHGMEEKIIQESGIPYTFLRPSAFMQNFVTQFDNTIKTKTDLDGKNFSEFTEVITRNIKPGNEKNYDDWLQRFMKPQDLTSSQVLL